MKLSSMTYYLKRPNLLMQRLAYSLYLFRHPDEPWLSPKSVRFLEKTLTHDMSLFEWGSGRSTLWFAKRMKQVVSIEYDGFWSKKVEQMLMDHKIQNVELFYIPLDHPKSDPTPKEYPEVPKYVSKIFDYEKESFDLVVIDGHYRLTCADQCHDYIRPGGYLLIDNSNRLAPGEWSVPKDWKLVHESANVVTQTSIWQKPN